MRLVTLLAAAAAQSSLSRAFLFGKRARPMELSLEEEDFWKRTLNGSAKNDEPSNDEVNAGPELLKVNAGPELLKVNAGPELLNLVDLIKREPDLSFFHDMVIEAGLLDVLKGDDPLTLFIPDNDAFEDLPDETLSTLMVETVQEDKDELIKLLTYHIVSGKALLSSDLYNGQRLDTMEVSPISVTIDEHDDIFVNDVPIVDMDNLAKNGVIHVISGVLVP